MDGYRATCLIVAALRLGVVDALGRGDVREDELADAIGAHPPSLARFLRGLRSLGLIEVRGARVGLTKTGRRLVEGRSVTREIALLTGEEYLPAWSAMQHSVLSGEPAFDRVFGASVWQHREEHPELGACFDRFMAGAQRRTLETVLAAFGFAGVGTVVDVGGGRGDLLAGILKRHPDVTGILFDQPLVVARAVPALAAAGMTERCRCVGGSFLETVPGGGDVYLLQHVLHDWDDERCRVILRNCRAAVPAHGTLLVMESALPDGPPDERDALRDLHMLVILGGRERTRAEYEGLLAEAGFGAVRWHGGGGETDVIEARPVASPV